MGMFDNLAGALGGLDINAIGAQIGLTPEQVQQVIAAIGQLQGQPGDTATAASAQTGLPLDKIQALLAQIGGPDALSKLGGMLGGFGR